MDTIWSAPSGEGAVRCMQMAMATAKNKIDYINTPRNINTSW
jgi:3-oxoacyl-(acyl-carrier-protein) synthase